MSEKEKTTPIEQELSRLSMDREQREFFAKRRELFLWDGVDDETAMRLVQQLLYLDAQSHEDITLFINSPGGVIWPPPAPRASAAAGPTPAS